MRLKKPLHNRHKFEHFYKIDVVAMRFFSEYKTTEDTYLTTMQQESYIINASVLKAALDLEAAMARWHCKLPIKDICMIVASFNFTLQQKYNAKHTLPLNQHHFKDVYKAFVNKNGEPFNYGCLLLEQDK